MGVTAAAGEGQYTEGYPGLVDPRKRKDFYKFREQKGISKVT